MYKLDLSQRTHRKQIQFRSQKNNRCLRFVQVAKKQPNTIQTKRGSAQRYNRSPFVYASEQQKTFFLDRDQVNLRAARGYQVEVNGCFRTERKKLPLHGRIAYTVSYEKRLASFFSPISVFLLALPSPCNFFFLFEFLCRFCLRLLPTSLRFFLRASLCLLPPVPAERRVAIGHSWPRIDDSARWQSQCEHEPRDTSS